MRGIGKDRACSPPHPFPPPGPRSSRPPLPGSAWWQTCHPLRYRAAVPCTQSNGESPSCEVGVTSRTVHPPLHGGTVRLRHHRSTSRTTRRNPPSVPARDVPSPPGTEGRGRRSGSHRIGSHTQVLPSVRRTGCITVKRGRCNHQSLVFRCTDPAGRSQPGRSPEGRPEHVVTTRRPTRLPVTEGGESGSRGNRRRNAHGM